VKEKQNIAQIPRNLTENIKKFISCTLLDVLLSQDYLRLAPSLQNKAGSIWTQNFNPHKEWQVEFSFRVSGRGYSGGEGLAFWYTKERGIAGDIYGSKDAWTGLAVFFDTSDMHEEVIMTYFNLLFFLFYFLFLFSLSSFSRIKSMTLSNIIYFHRDMFLTFMVWKMMVPNI